MLSAQKTAPRLCALFAAVAATLAMAVSPASAAPAAMQPRAASPEQVQQFNALEAELAAKEAPYIALQQKFDVGQLTAEQYRAAVAELDAKNAAVAATTSVPDLLRPRILGCTKDGYSVNIPVSLTLGTGDFSKSYDPKQPRGPMAMQMLQRLDQVLTATLRNANVHMIAVASKDDVLNSAFKTAIDTLLAKFSADFSAQMHIDLKVEAQPIEIASMPNCLIQPNAPVAPHQPSP